MELKKRFNLKIRVDDNDRKFCGKFCGLSYGDFEYPFCVLPLVSGYLPYPILLSTNPTKKRIYRCVDCKNTNWKPV